VTTDKGHKLATDKHMYFMETSARTGEHVQAAIQILLNGTVRVRVIIVGSYCSSGLLIYLFFCLRVYYVYLDCLVAFLCLRSSFVYFGRIQSFDLKYFLFAQRLEIHDPERLESASALPAPDIRKGAVLPKNKPTAMQKSANIELKQEEEQKAGNGTAAGESKCQC
jgi:hypothetical protein